MNIIKSKSNNKIFLPIYKKSFSGKQFDYVKPTFSENLSEFVKNSSLHGLKFVGDDRISLFERGFFLISFIIALLAAMNFIWEVYDEWVATPVIIGTNPDLTYINEIPFPAITICNMNQAMASKVKNINNRSVEYTILRTLCGRNPEIGEFQNNGTNNWSQFQNFIIDVAQPCSKMFVSCRYGANEQNCLHLFRPVITDEGVCCSFNLVDGKFMYKNGRVRDPFQQFSPPNLTAVDWSPEDGYQAKLPPRFFPRPAAGVGSAMGLSIILDAQSDEYYCSTTNGAGFKALLHNPTEIPDIANYGFSLQLGHETRVVINPEIADASYLLRDMHRKYRQCYFSNEANLSYYATYTRRNCELECEARLHMERCNCVHYYMPHSSANVNVCGLADLKCSDRVRFRNHETSEEVFQCSAECIPACFELKFRTETYSSDLSHKQFLIRDKQIQYMTEEYAAENIASVHFYYVERAFRSSTKQQFIGFTEFLSNTGGLMGLFLGFSVLSIMEIIYYLFMRPYFANSRYQADCKKSQGTKHTITAISSDLDKKARLRGAFMDRRFGKHLNTIGYGSQLHSQLDPKYSY